MDNATKDLLKRQLDFLEECCEDAEICDVADITHAMCHIVELLISSEAEEESCTD